MQISAFLGKKGLAAYPEAEKINTQRVISTSTKMLSPLGNTNYPMLNNCLHLTKTGFERPKTLSVSLRSYLQRASESGGFYFEGKAHKVKTVGAEE